jgi:hypothetical protein
MPATAPANAASVTTCYAGQANEYHIYVGQGLLSQVAPSVMATVGAERYVLLTDTNLHELHGERLVASFLAEGVELLVKVLTPGEVTKNRATKEEVEDWMLEHGCLRNTCVLALGGGVVGDFAGFVASTFMRGVPVVQIPASLLAMIDSSVGGKTGLDVPAGKNLIGAFHQPKAVYIDLDLLKTLPKRELVNGMGELIKYGAFWDEDLFSFLENSVDLILAKDGAAMQRIVQRSVEIKVRHVNLVIGYPLSCNCNSLSPSLPLFLFFIFKPEPEHPPRPHRPGARRHAGREGGGAPRDSELWPHRGPRHRGRHDAHDAPRRMRRHRHGEGGGDCEGPRPLRAPHRRTPHPLPEVVRGGWAAGGWWWWW